MLEPRDLWQGLDLDLRIWGTVIPHFGVDRSRHVNNLGQEVIPQLRLLGQSNFLRLVAKLSRNLLLTLMIHLIGMKPVPSSGVLYLTKPWYTERRTDQGEHHLTLVPVTRQHTNAL